MPTQYFTFTPQPKGPYQFQPTLDGNDYQAEVKWNIFGQRWYISLDAPNGIRVFNQALVGSQPAIAIQSLDWENGFVSMRCVFPHNFKAGDTNNIVVRGCLPDAYNGTYLAYAFDATTLVYPLGEPPGQAVTLGLASYEINLAATYFRFSTLVFRQGTQQFEVYSP